MVTIDQLVFETIRQCGKTNADVLEVSPDDPHFPTAIVIKFTDGTEAKIEIDISAGSRH